MSKKTNKEDFNRRFGRDADDVEVTSPAGEPIDVTPKEKNRAVSEDD